MHLYVNLEKKMQVLTKGQLDLLKLSKNQLIIMPTTNSAYGSASGDVYCENTKLNPISDYAKHKLWLKVN